MDLLLLINVHSHTVSVLKAPVLISNLLRCGILLDLLVLSSYVGKLNNMVVQNIKSSNKIAGTHKNMHCFGGRAETFITLPPQKDMRVLIFINDQTMHELCMSCTMYYCGTVFITLVTCNYIKLGQLCLINTPV